VTLRLDHVVYAVSDLEMAADRLHADGVETVPGGVHPRWGTANRIAPLGDAQYLELLGVADPEIAAPTALGRAIFDRIRDGDRWFAMCLADDQIEATAARLGLDVELGGRRLPDGGSIAWRGAGIDDPRRSPDLPFFIAWEVGAGAHPGDASVEHPSGADGIAWVEIAGDRRRFQRWVGGADVPVRFVEGAAGVTAVGLSTPRGELILR
jgi:glyoxalase-like protein